MARPFKFSTLQNFDEQAPIASDIPATAGEFVPAFFERGSELSPLSSLNKAADLRKVTGQLENPYLEVGFKLFEQLGLADVPDDSLEVISAEALNEKFGIPGELKFSKPGTSEGAALLHDNKKREISNRLTLDRTKGFLNNAAGFSFEFLGEMADPISLTLLLLPTIQTVKAIGLAKNLSRVAAGAVEGGVGTALAIAPAAAIGDQLQSDFGATEGATSILYGAAFGAGIRSIIGISGDALKNRSEKIRTSGRKRVLENKVYDDLIEIKKNNPSDLEGITPEDDAIITKMAADQLEETNTVTIAEDAAKLSKTINTPNNIIELETANLKASKEIEDIEASDLSREDKDSAIEKIDALIKGRSIKINELKDNIGPAQAFPEKTVEKVPEAAPIDNSLSDKKGPLSELSDNISKLEDESTAAFLKNQEIQQSDLPIEEKHIARAKFEKLQKRRDKKIQKLEKKQKKDKGSLSEINRLDAQGSSGFDNAASWDSVADSYTINLRELEKTGTVRDIEFLEKKIAIFRKEARKERAKRRAKIEPISFNQFIKIINKNITGAKSAEDIATKRIVDALLRIGIVASEYPNIGTKLVKLLDNVNALQARNLPPAQLFNEVNNILGIKPSTERIVPNEKFLDFDDPNKPDILVERDSYRQYLDPDDFARYPTDAPIEAPITTAETKKRPDYDEYIEKKQKDQDRLSSSIEKRYKVPKESDQLTKNEADAEIEADSLVEEVTYDAKTAEEPEVDMYQEQRIKELSEEEIESALADSDPEAADEIKKILKESDDELSAIENESATTTDVTNCIIKTGGVE